jgi:hypothetical protein
MRQSENFYDWKFSKGGESINVLVIGHGLVTYNLGKKDMVQIDLYPACLRQV